MRKVIFSLLAVVILLGLYAASRYNFLLFHSIAEGFSIVIAFGIFMVAWNTRQYNPNNYLAFIGIAYLFIGILDFSHTIAYDGMNIFVDFDANAPTQLWIATRYMESLTLLIAPFLLNRRIRVDVCFAAYGLISIAILLSVFYWRIFPDSFLPEAGGLTPFKIYSEYIICLILLVSGIFFFYRRDRSDPQFLKWVLMSIAATIAAELLFTTYGSVYGSSNLLGHYLKIISFYLMYKAVIETGLTKPYDVLFRNLQQLNETLELRVVERTTLAESRLKQLQSLAVELIEAEEQERKRIAVVLHDDLQQLLAGAKMHVEAASAGLSEASSSSAGFLSTVNNLLSESIDKSRLLSHELSSPVLHHSGLVAGLEWLARKMNEQLGLRVKLATDDAPPVESSTLKVIVFRSVQELLFNIVKHAGVKEANVHISTSNGHIVTVVSDEGRGFDPRFLDTFDTGTGFGLLNLQERVRSIGGNLRVESAVGQGSKFTLTVPLRIDHLDD